MEDGIFITTCKKDPFVFGHIRARSGSLTDSEGPEGQRIFFVNLENRFLELANTGIPTKCTDPGVKTDLSPVGTSYVVLVKLLLKRNTV